MGIELIWMPLAKVGIILMLLGLMAWLLKRKNYRLGGAVAAFLAIMVIFAPMKLTNKTVQVKQQTQKIAKVMTEEIPERVERTKRSLDGAMAKFKVTRKEAQKVINDELNKSK